MVQIATAHSRDTSPEGIALLNDSAIAHLANDKDLTLKAAALEVGYVDAADFDQIVDPKMMIGHGVAGAE